MPESDAPPLLVEGARFEGLLVLPRTARIDGHVRGEVIAEADVEVGLPGLVEAPLEARSLRVEGRVHGALRARDRIQLGPAAEVRGDVEAPRLAMAEGARIEGRCRVGVPTP